MSKPPDPSIPRMVSAFSRRLIHRRSPALPLSEHAVRWLDIEVPEEGFGLSVVHIPGSGTRVKCGEKRGAENDGFGMPCLKPTARTHERFLLVGDFNTGLHGIDEVGSTFRCAKDFARLSAIGWTDVWRSFHGQATEYTWFSRVKGRPSRQRLPSGSCLRNTESFTAH